MPEDATTPAVQPRALTVLMRNGQPMLTTIHENPQADIAADRAQLRRMEEKARQAPPERLGELGYVMFMGRRHISRIQDLMAARYDDVHHSAWVEVIDGIDCTACTCRVLVAGRVGVDFTEEEFRDAEGHVPFVDPEQDERVCPRCGHGLPNDREPGSTVGFWSLTLRRGYVCDACHDHQMHLGYNTRNLGDEQWPVTVPQRFYDESWWPPRPTSATDGADHE